MATFAHLYGTDGDTSIDRNSLTEVAIFVHFIYRVEICKAAVMSVFSPYYTTLRFYYASLEEQPQPCSLE